MPPAYGIGFFDLAFCAGVLTIGALKMNLAIDTLQTMTLMTLAFNSQAVFYVAGERKRLWSSRPSVTVILSSGVEFLIIAALADQGILMALSPAKNVSLAYGTTAS